MTSYYAALYRPNNDWIPVFELDKGPRLVWLVTWCSTYEHGLVGVCSSHQEAGKMAKRRADIGYEEDIVIRSVILDQECDLV